jgi:ADP-glucose pyrophosphorylase
MLVLTQYKSHSLHKHLRDGWSVFNPELREYITPVPAERLSRAPTSIVQERFRRRPQPGIGFGDLWRRQDR